MPKPVIKQRIIPPDDALIIKAIGELAKELRKKTGLSYEEFATQNGINRITYYKFESGNQNFTVSILIKIVRGLGMTLKQFFALLDQTE